jgi:hypothetical protein
MNNLKEKLEKGLAAIDEYNHSLATAAKIIEAAPPPRVLIKSCLEMLEALETIATHVDDIESYELAREAIAKIERRFNLNPEDK